MIVREAVPEDRAELEKLWKGEPFWPFAFTWKDFWAKPPVGARWLVAEEEGRILGSAHVRRRPKDGVVYIHEIVTAPTARQRGVGSLLLAAMGSPIELKTNEDNEASNAFYQRCGFYRSGASFTRSGARLIHYRRDE